MELAYMKLNRLMKIQIEDFTYENVMYYTLHVGTVNLILINAYSFQMPSIISCLNWR